MKHPLALIINKFISFYRSDLTFVKSVECDSTLQITLSDTWELTQVCSTYFLINHSSVNSISGERPYKCQYCDRSYAQSNDLLKHTRIHVGENTYKCNLCTAAFRLQAQLREHYRIHYDASSLTLRSDSLDQKPSMSEMEMIVDEQQRRDHEMQFVQQMMKSEANDDLLTEKLLYQDLSKKQKLDQWAALSLKWNTRLGQYLHTIYNRYSLDQRKIN